MIDCRHVIRRMWELLDGEVPPTEAEEIRAHLAECARCNPEYQFQLAFLSAVDEERRLDSILDSYLRMLDDDKVMVARYFVQTLHLIPEARPDLREKVIACLLDVENTHHTESRKSLLKADIINAFDRLFEGSSTWEQEQILAFVEKEQDSESPTTRKAAKAFQKKHIIA